MVIEAKVKEVLGEIIDTKKGGHILEILVLTSQGKNEVFKLHASSDQKSFLTALKSGDIVSCSLPENFFFLRTK